MSPLENKIEELQADIDDLSERLATLNNHLTSKPVEEKSDPLGTLKLMGSWNYQNVLRKTAIVPTHIPRTREEQVVLFVNSTETKLYVYNNSAWKYTSLT
jgi:hypothetical protein